MRLYAGSSKLFIEDTYQNRISEKLRISYFEQFGCNPSQPEINSWKNSLRATSMVFEHAHLTDHGVIVEYQLPQSSKRLDCMICGKDDAGKDKAVIMELKQWDRCKQADGENEVVTWVGGSERETLHPSAQVGQYRAYLEDTHTAFHEGSDPIQLNACAYLHNYPYDPKDVLFDGKFREVVLRNPVFTMDDVPRLETFLVDWVGAGQGLEVLRRVEDSKYRPSKKLMDHVGNVVKGKPEYVLPDEQHALLSVAPASLLGIGELCARWASYEHIDPSETLLDPLLQGQDIVDIERQEVQSLGQSETVGSVCVAGGLPEIRSIDHIETGHVEAFAEATSAAEQVHDLQSTAVPWHPFSYLRLQCTTPHNCFSLRWPIMSAMQSSCCPTRSMRAIETLFPRRRSCRRGTMSLARRSQLEMALIRGIVTMAFELWDGDGCPHGSSEVSTIVQSLLSQAGFRIGHVRGTRSGVDHRWYELAYPGRHFEYIMDLSALDTVGPSVLSKASPEAGVYRGYTPE